MKRYRNGWWLDVKYHDEGLTQREIAEECGVSPRTVRKYMDRFGVESRELAGEDHPLYGTERDEAVREQISDTLSGRDYPEEWRRRAAEAHEGNEVPPEAREKISESLDGIERPEETRRKMSESRVGPDNPNWKGGNVKNYGPGWSAARERVRERDEVCQHCGHDGSDLPLDVHHIVPVRQFREADDADVREANDESNLVLLCRSCHGRAEHGVIEFESGVEPPSTTTKPNGKE